MTGVRSVGARLRRIAMVFVSILVLDWSAVHLLPNIGAAWRSAGQGSPVLLVLALILELASIASYSGITSTLLPRGARLRYPTVLAIDVTGLGFSHLLPGGGASSAALRIRLWARRGVDLPDAVSTGAIEYAVTVVWLVVMLLVGIIVATPHPKTSAPLRVALVVAIVAVMLLCGVLAVLAARPDQVVTITHSVACRLPILRPQTLERIARSMIEQVRLAVESRDRSRRAVLWGLGNWGLDAASLFLCVTAFGPLPNPGGILTTYALVNLLALLPITPGGLGLVEGVAVPSLVSFGVGPVAALLGVLSWRLFEFWLPIPGALATFLTLSAKESRYPAAPERRTT